MFMETLRSWQHDSISWVSAHSEMWSSWKQSGRDNWGKSSEARPTNTDSSLSLSLGLSAWLTSNQIQTMEKLGTKKKSAIENSVRQTVGKSRLTCLSHQCKVSTKSRSHNDVLSNRNICDIRWAASYADRDVCFFSEFLKALVQVTLMQWLVCCC